MIVPISRGGLIPGRLLSSKLHVKTMYALTVIKNGFDRLIITEIKEDLKNKVVLVVEDMLETGTSMEVSKAYLEEKGAIVKTACLYTMPQTTIIPDYLLRQVSIVVVFPWE